jgi:hypothetical protein
VWALIHSFIKFQELSGENYFIIQRISESIEAAFKFSPQSFIIGGFSMIIGIQLISLGILSLQSKRYFEEIFHLGTTIYKSDLDQLSKLN